MCVAVPSIKLFIEGVPIDYKGKNNIRIEYKLFVEDVPIDNIQSVSWNLAEIQFTNALDLGNFLWNGR